MLAKAAELRLLLRAGSGLDNLDLDSVAEKGIRLQRFPGPGARAVAEMAFGLMLSLARQIPLTDRLLQQGHWMKNEATGYLLAGKTLGIVGCGNIGGMVGELGVAWGMHVLGCTESATAEDRAGLARRRIRLASFTEVLDQADFLSIHVPLKESTRHLIGSQELARMKPNAFLINLARGGVVDEDALFDSLAANGHLAGAALDVHRQEGEGKISVLAGLPNVVLTPHIGATTVDTQREIGLQLVAVVEQFAGEKAPHVRSQPENAACQPTL